MTADPRLTWGTSTSPRPEPLADRRYPRCHVCGGPWHGLPTTFLGTWCETSIDGLRRGAGGRVALGVTEGVDGPQIDAEAVA